MLFAESLTLETTANTLLFFSFLRLLVLIGWVYLCIYTVIRVEYSPLIPDRFRLLASILAFFIGPFMFFLLVTIDIAQKLQSGEMTPDEVLPTVIRSIFGSKGDPAIKNKQKRFIELMDSSGKSFKELYGSQSKSTEEAKKTLDLTERIIYDAINARASDLLIDPVGESQYSVRFRVDGFLRTQSKMGAEKSVAVINSIKAISAMDIAEKRRPQDGSFMAKTRDASIYFRVATAGVMGGEKITIRLLNQTAGMLSLEDIGATKANMAILENAIKQPSGMIVVCGPTGSGKTTSLYALLKEVDLATRNVITVEDPVEYVLQNTSQIEVNPKADITFAKALRSILRQDPDIIVVGEIRDPETAAMALQASQTGHLVLATLHSSSNLATLVRMMDLGVKPLLLSSALNLIVSQRLVRKLCDNCKRPADLSEKQIAYFKAKRVNPAAIMTADGCKKCGGTGYLGRSAIMDVMPLDDKIRNILANDKLTPGDIKEKGDKHGRSTLKKEGMKKILKGITTFEEVKRVTTNLG